MTMAKRILNLRYPATCSDCGAALEVGAPARYYARGKVYGTECHERGAAVSTPAAELETDAGGHCEDYPCCGHGSGMCSSERRAEKRAEARRAVPGSLDAPTAKPVTPQVAAPAPYFGGETPADYPMSYNDRAQELMEPFGAD